MNSRKLLAAELEQFAAAVLELPGVSRRNPHLFVEAKDELAERLRRRALEFRATNPVRARLVLRWLKERVSAGARAKT